MVYVFTNQRIRLMSLVSALFLLIVLLTAQAPLPNTPGIHQDGYVPPYVTLEGRALLPADTFAAGPPSGFAIAGTYYGRQVPFESQPVQGVSALVRNWNGNYLVLLDNGYGTRSNSGDFLLRWYEVALDFKTGSVTVLGHTHLKDPYHRVPWGIVNEEQRTLTGADFDPESFQQTPDGTFWIGDEFGPYLLHVDALGNLLDKPFALPYPEPLAMLSRGRPTIQTADNADFFALPTREDRERLANQGDSRGLEGLAMNSSGTKLYTLLEGAMTDDPISTRVFLQEFDLITRQFTTNYWFYPLEHPDHAIGEIVALDDYKFLVLERDRGQGADAQFKRVYRVNIEGEFPGTTLTKRLVADLMAIVDHTGITQPAEGVIGTGTHFSLPFISIEGIYPVDDKRIIVVNDNNYPFGSARQLGVPDDTEFVLLGLSETLGVRR